MNHESAEIVIIGAGVAGLGIGWELCRHGHDVVIYEKDTAGSGASRAAAGMLAPTAEVQFGESDLLRMGLRSLQLYPEFVGELQAASGLDVDYRGEGTLIVGVDRDDAESLDRIYGYYVELDLPVQRLSAQEARELEPGLSPDIQLAVRCPEDHQIDPRRLVDALVQAFRNAGGKLREHTAVDGIDCSGGKVTGVRVGDATVSADIVLVAAGAWTPQLTGVDRGVMPRIRPVRGQMLSIELGQPVLCRHVIRAPDAYLVPKSDGRLIIGATSEERGFDRRMTAGGVMDILRGAWEALPGVYDQPIVEMWTGFRPVSLDNLPVLGPSSVEGLWFATGHGRSGILHTPATSRLMAQALDGKTDPMLAPFGPARFER